MRNFIKKIPLIVSKRTWPPVIQKVFYEEEYHGAVTTNRIRYIIFFLLLISVIVGAIGSYKEGTLIGVVSNIASLAAFLAITIIHTIVLRKGSTKLINIFGYIVIIFDYILITMALVVWYLLVIPENPSIILKNSAISLYIFAISITVLQFRVGYVVFSTAIFLFTYYSIVLLCHYMDVPVAQTWIEYFLGPNIIIADAVTTRPLAFIGVGVIIGYAIKRAYNMVLKIGKVESQKASLSRYFSPAVVEEITSKPDILSFGARQKVSILFCDIRDFTKMSENMEPDDLSDFLSEFRKVLTQAIFKHSGTLDKYIGDAILATFGTPKPSTEQGRDSKNALMAAFSMIDAIDAFNKNRIADGIEPIRIGIALHTGEVFVGNIGFEDQMEYTVIGDVVNTASRIESLCKKFQTQFLVSDEIYQEIYDLVEVENLPRVLVKGKEKPIKLFKVVDKKY